MNATTFIKRLEDEQFNSCIGRRSTVHIKDAIRSLEQGGGEVIMYEDWFRSPLEVVEYLADRLAFSEQCIKEGINWKEYRKLSKEYRAGQ